MFVNSCSQLVNKFVTSTSRKKKNDSTVFAFPNIAKLQLEPVNKKAKELLSTSLWGKKQPLVISATL